MVSSNSDALRKHSAVYVLALLRVVLLMAGILCVPLAVAIAQTSDTQTSTEQKKEEEKKKAEEEEIQTQEQKLQEEITVTGTRVEGRVATEAPAPVDIIDSETLRSTGATETGKVLQLLAPSFNFSSTTISDGTDIIRPATLRSLGSDQVLVLVNGKRRHQQALLNVQQTIARGEAGTDINAIPISAIDHVEVLRDGAAAQYGSDAIAGVINIILKDGVEGNAMVQSGETYEGDGAATTVGVNKGFKVGQDSIINVTGEFRDRGETNRAGVDSLRVDPPRVTQRIGDADSQDGAFWANTDFSISGGHLYAFGGYSHRHGNSSGFFRSAGDGRTIPDIYPNGFLPTIITTPIDGSVVVGYKRAINPQWNYDAAFNYGRSEFKFREENTANVSWFYEPLDPNNPTGPRFDQTPTSADTGTLIFNQKSLTFDLLGHVGKVGTGPLHLATGFEWRQDGYQIKPGDPVSYTYGRTNNRSIPILDQTNNISQPGTQGFPGWSPLEEVNDNRDNIALYADAETQVTKEFLLGGAVRYEHYSDFGNTVTGKFSARYDIDPKFAVRGTISNGFRAPGIQQALYSQRSTNLNAAGVLTDTLTARQGGAVTQAFGIPPLKEETSKNYSFGVVTRPNDMLRLTLDFYRIDIDNRIIFSSNIQPESGPCATPADCPIATILNQLGVGQILFFTNAINTSTKGLDIVALYDIRIGNNSLLSLEGAFAFNKTHVTDRHSPSTILPADVLFDQTEVTLIEEGQPRQHHTLSATYYHGPWSSDVRFNYFGAVSGDGFTPNFKQTWGGKWLTDLSVSYALQSGFTFTVGGINIFNVYPDKWDPVKASQFPQLGFVYGWETLPF
ncbi:MAG TPA: TonB-dependent receptor, partial [Acidobacteriota bacterium]|nr:TonB-dependent receptor [Acidobacteriota bacterium]